MTPKRIEWDSHAVDQMRERHIRKDDVRWVLAQGLSTEAEQSEHSEPVFARRGYVERREIKVVYLENAKRVFIITVMRTDEVPPRVRAKRKRDR